MPFPWKCIIFPILRATSLLDWEKVDWSLVRNYGFELGKLQGYESSNRLFLSSKYNFSVIEADQGKRKERFLFGYRVPEWFDENDLNWLCSFESVGAQRAGKL